MTFTHRRISRNATCTKVTLTNMAYILDLLNSSKNIEASTYGKDIMIRRKKRVKGQPDIDTIGHGHWIVEQENGEVKVMNGAEFRSKYEVIE